MDSPDELRRLQRSTWPLAGLMGKKGAGKRRERAVSNKNPGYGRRSVVCDIDSPELEFMLIAWMGSKIY